MAVALRLRREGNRNRPMYRIVAADSRAPRDGRFIEILGTYNPALKTDNYRIHLERVESWLSNGARPSDTVKSIIKKARRGDGGQIITDEVKETPPSAAKKPVAEAPKPVAEEPVKTPEPEPVAEEEKPAPEKPEETPASEIAAEDKPAEPVSEDKPAEDKPAEEKSTED